MTLDPSQDPYSLKPTFLLSTTEIYCMKLRHSKIETNFLPLNNWNVFVCNTSVLLVYSQGFYNDAPQDRQPLYMNGMYGPGNEPQPQQPIIYYNNYLNTLPRRITQDWSRPTKQIALHNDLSQKPKSKHFLPRKFNLSKGKRLTASLYLWFEFSIVGISFYFQVIIRTTHLNSCCVSITYWFTDWLTDRLIEWLTDWLTDSLNDWLTDWLTDTLNDCLTHSLTEWLADSLTHWLTVWLTHSLPHWLTEWMIDWLTDWLTDLLTDWLSDWLTDWLIDWLTD